jgi:hypothetical protein
MWEGHNSQVHCSKLTELPRRVQVLDGRSEVTQLRAADSDPGAAEPPGGRHVERLVPMSSSICATPPANVIKLFTSHRLTAACWDGLSPGAAHVHGTLAVL